MPAQCLRPRAVVVALIRLPRHRPLPLFSTVEGPGSIKLVRTIQFRRRRPFGPDWTGGASRLQLLLSVLLAGGCPTRFGPVGCDLPRRTGRTCFSLATRSVRTPPLPDPLTVPTPVDLGTWACSASVVRRGRAVRSGAGREVCVFQPAHLKLSETFRSTHSGLRLEPHTPHVHHTRTGAGGRATQSTGSHNNSPAAVTRRAAGGWIPINPDASSSSRRRQQ